MLQPEEHCTKYGEKVMEVLHNKHPDIHTSSMVSLDNYHGRTQALVPFNVTE